MDFCRVYYQVISCTVPYTVLGTSWYMCIYKIFMYTRYDIFESDKMRARMK